MPSVKAIACVSLFTFALAASPILAQDRPSPPSAATTTSNSPGDTDTPRNRDGAPPEQRRAQGDGQAPRGPMGGTTGDKAGDKVGGPPPGGLRPGMNGQRPPKDGQRPAMDGQRPRPPGDGDDRVGQRSNGGPQNKPPRSQGERPTRDQTATPPASRSPAPSSDPG